MLQLYSQITPKYKKNTKNNKKNVKIRVKSRLKFNKNDNYYSSGTPYLYIKLMFISFLLSLQVSVKSFVAKKEKS